MSNITNNEEAEGNRYLDQGETAVTGCWPCCICTIQSTRPRRKTTAAQL
jgi:hypothetical protein